MSNLLNQYFPMFHTKAEIQQTIQDSDRLSAIWDNWKPEYREDFLNWCSGAKGMKVLYDSFFKEVMNPELAPERLSDMLSTLLQRKITVKQALPVDSTRIANEQSLVIMDIVVELEDGSMADIEVQKCGYQFAGQRASCYGADLILRQYKRVRDRKGDKFRFGEVKPVYVIVFMENSRYFFHKEPEVYRYRFPDKDRKLASDLGLLENYLFIPLDNFKQRRHNSSINNKTDAWLTFLSTDEPERIIQLIQEYPEFQNLYETLFQMCQNVERVMEMFSKELEIIDRNTVMGMIDEMDETIQKQGETIQEQGETIQKQDKMLAENVAELLRKDEALAEQNEKLAEKDGKLAEQNEKLAEQSEQIRILQEKLRQMQDIKYTSG